MKFNVIFRMKRPLTLLLLILVWHTCAAGSLTPGNLRCEYLTSPLGIDPPKPRLSWTLEAKDSHARAVSQSAFRVLVASSSVKLAANNGDLWDSGKINSDQSISLCYAGRQLLSGQECFWKVQVWDQDGKPSAWSRSAKWSMGLLESKDWKGRWIGLDALSPDRPANPLANAQWIWSPDAKFIGNCPIGQRYFRRSFLVPTDRTVKRAVCWVAGDNDYECFLNGVKLGKGAYDQAKQFDFTDRLRSGTNVFSAVVSNGGDSPNPAGLLATIRIEFADEPFLIITTDRQWRVAKESSAKWQETDFTDDAWLTAKEFGLNGIKPWKEITPESGPRLPARMLRREFTLPAPPKRAMLYASGLGLSEFYLNGRKVGDHVLSPGLTDYQQRVFYVTFDVTAQVKRGRNCIGALLGNGRYFSPRPTSSTTYGFPKLLLQLRVEHADGSVTEVVSDDSWRVTDAGPIRANNEYDGEIYDARREQSGWAEPGFNDAQWQPAQPVAAPGGKLSAQMMNPIRVTGVLKPVRLTQPRPGVFIFDMGQNMVGWCRLKVRGPQGTEITLRHAETLRPDGTLYMDNIRGAKATDSYTLNGKGVEIYEPRFAYHGFRYVELQGYPGKPALDALEGCVVNDDLETIGTFACSNPLLNRIYTNVVWSVRGNYRSLPTDCPQRDERQGWLGDRSAESRGEAFIFDNSALYAKWVQDMADAQRTNGSISDVCPAYWPLYSDSATWPSSFVLIPGAMLDQFGDTELVARTYPAMSRWMNHMSGYLTNNLMLRDTYGDWCVPPEDPQLIHSKDPARKTAPGVLGTAYFYHCLKLMTRYATLLNKTEDARQWQDMSARLKAAFNRESFNEAAGYYDNGSQTACVLPLMFGLVPPEQSRRVCERLVEKITGESRNHVGTGLVGSQWLLRTLSDNGQSDLAYTLASQKTYPSWGYMVEKGATTLWELWNGDTADPAMNSQNHVMLTGDLIIWFYEYLAGIQSDPESPGFHHIIMRPHPVGDLQWVKATHRSPYGMIASHWQRQDSRLHWVVTIPPNTTATLYLPCSKIDGVIEGGKPAALARGIRSIVVEQGHAVVEIKSGSYNFEMEVDH